MLLWPSWQSGVLLPASSSGYRKKQEEEGRVQRIVCRGEMPAAIKCVACGVQEPRNSTQAVGIPGLSPDSPGLGLISRTVQTNQMVGRYDGKQDK